MAGFDSFGLVNLGSVEGGVVLLPVGDVDLTDPSGEVTASLLTEVSVYHPLDLGTVFSESGRNRLETLRLGIEKYITPDSTASTHSPRSLGELRRMLRDLCADDLRGLEKQRPMGKLQFANPGMARRGAERFLSGDGGPQERLSQLIAMVWGFEADFPCSEREKLLFRRIEHLMVGHREAVQPAHIQDLLQLSLQRRVGLLKPILGAVGDWSVGDHVKVLAELIRREHLAPLIALANMYNQDARAILRGLFGSWQGMHVAGNHPTFDLFTGDHLWGLFDLMQGEPVTERSWGSVTEGVWDLARYRPAIFTAEHVAWLKTLAPFQAHEDEIHGTVNEYDRILEKLREKRPDLFPKRGWLSGGRKKFKSLAEAQLAAEQIRGMATARELVHVDTTEERASGGAGISG